jgi:hypothetical protein
MMRPELGVPRRSAAGFGEAAVFLIRVVRRSVID